MPDPELILVTGANGCVGGRLVPRLLEAGYRARCLVRDPERLRCRAWLPQVDIVSGDVPKRIIYLGGLGDPQSNLSPR
jgi:uncharacterized protein YbjT (DUF2867 family)